MRRWLKSDVALLVWRLVVAYLTLALCRLVFGLYNAEALAGTFSEGELWRLIKGSLVFDTATVIYTYGIFILLSLLPFRFRSHRVYRGVLFGYFVLATAVTVVVNFGDAIYFHYTQKRFTADELFFASNDNSLQLVLKFAAENWYLVLCAVLFVVLAAKLYLRRVVPQTPIDSRVGYYAVNTLLLAVVAGLCVGGVRGGFSRMTRPITLSNAAQYASTPARSNLILSNPFCILRTAGRSGSLAYTEYFPEQCLDSLFSPYHLPAGTPGLGRRNVLIFVLESFSAEHSGFLNPDLYPSDGGFTPFLDSLMRNGYTFTRAYANGHKSIEALPSVLGSIPSFKTPFVLMPQSLGESRQLPRLLEEQGYSTAFFCGSSRGSMGFEAYVRSAGVQEVYGREDYEAVHGRGDFDGYWGIWDEPFLCYMGEVLGTMSEPFLGTVFTTTSHHPFVVPESCRDQLPEGRTRIHKGVAYTDRAIRRFFDRYGNEPWFRNTIFVFVADHVSSETFAPKTRTEVGRNHIIQFLYTPDGSLRCIDSHTAQQVDLMPTLLGLIGNRSPYFAFGRDVLNEPGRTPWAFSYAQGYIAVTDSLTLFFDESRPSAVYAAEDTLLRTNLLEREPDSSLVSRGVPDVERRLKALIQQYYGHVSRLDFLPRIDTLSVGNFEGDSLFVSE